MTGAAGFIGSHLSERLVADGHKVVGLDAFTEYYDPSLKRRNIRGLLDQPGFQLVEADLASTELSGLVGDCDVVYHLAAQPGVRASWGDDFRIYLERNLWATQRLLEALRGEQIKKLVFASSSSIYGDADRYPTTEDDLPQPISPYGVSKLAGERLCLAYARSYGVPVVAVRYFTVYGPRQRPDMGFSRFMAALRSGREIEVFGDGKQTRDFTYVSDAVAATVAAAECEAIGEAVNVGGGSRVTVLEVLGLLGELAGAQPRIHFVETQRGDVHDTGADLTKAIRLLGYLPRVTLRDGLAQQLAAQR